MATNSEWIIAYARQADADFRAWQAVRSIPAVGACHRMLFLQMVCEKLCKAHLIQAGTPPAVLRSSHGYVAKPLPVVIRQQIDFLGGNPRKTASVIPAVRHLAREIEVANPACDRDGRRPDNCEYPWENGNGMLHSPLDWTFAPTHLLTQAHGRTFLKLLRGAIDRLLE